MGGTRAPARLGPGARLCACVALALAAARAAIGAPLRPVALGGLDYLTGGGGGGFAGPFKRPDAGPAALEEQVLQLMPSGMGAVREAFVALVEKQCDLVFEEVDHDGSGTLDSKELHVAVLLVYGRLNQMLGSTAVLSLPLTKEVKRMLREASGGKSELGRDEFRRSFVRIFVPRVAVRVIANVLTNKILVPALAIAINGMQQKLEFSSVVEDLAVRGQYRGVDGMIKKNIKKALADKAVDTFGKACGPIVTLQLAGLAIDKLRVERGLVWLLGGTGEGVRLLGGTGEGLREAGRLLQARLAR